MGQNFGIQNFAGEISSVLSAKIFFNVIRSFKHVSFVSITQDRISVCKEKIIGLEQGSGH